jgi:hypothetical protein
MKKPSSKQLGIGIVVVSGIVLIAVFLAHVISHSSTSYHYSSQSSSYQPSEPPRSSDSSSPPDSSSPSEPHSDSGDASTPSAVVPLEGASAVPLVPKSSPYCHALAPADWSAEGSPTGNTMDLFNPDHTEYVAWGVSSVDRGVQQFYGDMWADPETAMLYLVNSTMLPALGDSSSAEYNAETAEAGDWKWRYLASARHAGMIIYHLYDAVPGTSPGSYTLSARYVLVDESVWDRDRWLAFGVASSIGCVTQLVPSYSGSSSRGGSRRKLDESDDLRGYNAQLGSQWAHSPSTGENFLLDRSARYNDSGPDGPGYYRQAGNSYEKLEMGWAD